MAQKPQIQYVGQFYVYGSEAQQPQVKPKKPKTTLPKLRLERLQKIYVDPVAVLGLTAAAVMLVVLIFGAFQLHRSLQEYKAMEAVVSELKHENADLSHSYHTGYDLDEVRIAAENMGLVEVSEVEQFTIPVSVPERQPEPTRWDEFVWLMKGLFANAKR